MLPLRTIPVHTEFLALLPRLSASRAGWNRAAHTLGMFFLGPAIAAAVMAALGFAPVFQLAACALLLAAIAGAACPDRRMAAPTARRLAGRAHRRPDRACCERTPTCGAPWASTFSRR